MKLSTISVAIISSLINLTSAAPTEDWTVSLLKRQEPGTPLYDCHLACGTSVALGREANYCSNVPFLINYTNCLDCAGPNNFDIWQYYGATLTTRGSACGLSTTPA